MEKERVVGGSGLVRRARGQGGGESVAGADNEILKGLGRIEEKMLSGVEGAIQAAGAAWAGILG